MNIDLADEPLLCDLKTDEEKEEYCQKHFGKSHSETIKEWDMSSDIGILREIISQCEREHPE